MPSGPADVDSRDESEVSPGVETEGINTCGLSSVASCTRGANVISGVRLFVDPGLFPVSNGKVADFIPLIHVVRSGSEQHPWVANVPVASGASTLVRCGAGRACLMIGVDMAAPEE